MQSEYPKYINPEVKQVTERTYEQYLEHLAIPEDMLKDKVILDVGAGFANFVQKVNEKFGSEGTRAIAVDPVYAFFNRDVKRFKDSIERSRLFLSFSEGQKPFKGVDIDKWDEAEETFYKEFYKQARDTGNYVAGTHQSLPFKNESVDLIFDHNSIMGFDDRVITTNALNECLRVIKSDGEIRLRPSPFQLHPDKDEGVVLAKFGEVTREDMQKYQTGQTVVDDDLFKFFVKLQSEGVNVYTYSIKGDDRLFFGNAILRKDNSPPMIDREVEDFHDLRLLDFAGSSDGYNIPSHVVS